MLKCAVFAFDYKCFVSFQVQIQVHNRFFTQKKVFTLNNNNNKKSHTVLIHYLFPSTRKIKNKETKIVKEWRQVKNSECQLQCVSKKSFFNSDPVINIAFYMISPPPNSTEVMTSSIAL